MDASDLKMFEAVAQAGSITKAADRLNTVQSNVTTRIRLLEAELGVTLFQRHPRGVSMTIAGERLLPYATRTARLLAEARDLFDEKAEPQGKLLFGTLETTAAMRLPPVLAAFRRQYPRVEIAVRTGTAASLIDDVIAHRIEGAFVAGPVDMPDLVKEPMFREELVLVTAANGPTLDELAIAGEAEILAFRLGCAYRRKLEVILAAHGIARVRTMELGTLEGIIGLVGAGIGVTLLPRVSVAAAAAAGQVRIHELPAELSFVETFFIRRRDAFHSSAAARLVEIARAIHGRNETMVAAAPRRVPEQSAPMPAI